MEINDLAIINNQTIQNKIYTLRGVQEMLDEKHRKYLPYGFTEQGVSMLSAVLRSQTAIEVSIKIIDNFINMRKFISQNASLFTKIETIEKRQISYEIKNDSKVDAILNTIEKKGTTQKQHIFYDGQIFDTYLFVSNIIKSAKISIKIEIEKFELSHDRFLIIDEKEVYHFGASLKDLGKKWFAVSKLDMAIVNIVEKLK